jgi:hypothetical protein
MKKVLIILVLLSFTINGFGRIVNKTKPSQKPLKKTNDSFKEIKDTIKDTIKDRMVRTYIIEYNFQTGLFPNKKKIKPRVDVPVVFKITNINRLAYTVKIESKDSVIGFSDLSDLERLLTKDEVTKIADDLKKLETSIPLQNNNLPVNPEDFLKTDNKKDTTLTKLVNDINKTNIELLDQLNTQINSLIKNTDKKRLSLDSIIIPKRLDDNFPFHFTTQIALTETYLNILEKHQTLITLWSGYLQVNTFINNPLLNLENLTETKDTLLIIYNKYNNNKNILNDFNLLVNRFQNLYNSLKLNPEITKQTNYGGSIKLLNIADNLNIEVKSLQQQIDIIKFATLKKNIDQIYSLLVLNNDTTSLFEYVSDPIQPFQDIAIFTVKVNKKDKDNSLFFNERDFSYRANTKHGIRYDLNIGLAGSFYAKDNFHEINVDTLNVRRIYKADKSGFSPSFVGFFTTSYRSATHFTGGLSVGLGIGADDGSIKLDNFFVGLSGIFGRYERINLTTGVSLKSLPRLNNGYKEGQEVPNNFTLDNITTKSYQPGFFIALTYNLTKGVKDQLKFLK